VIPGLVAVIPGFGWKKEKKKKKEKNTHKKHTYKI